MRVLIFSSFVLLTAWGCYYDSKEYLFPEINTSCDTTQITFTGSVKPILQQYCFSCHSNNTAPSYGGNIKLEDYGDVKLRVDNGSLLGTISHAGGYSPMPKGASKLGDCPVNVVQKWIEAGNPNN